MTFNSSAQTLRDLGERRIITELIAPHLPDVASHIISIGDDCAVIPLPPPGDVLVLTTDPCPDPVICTLEPPDFYHYGRLSILINVSDLAAMGATPMGMVVSTVMPEDMLVSDYKRFLEGLADASKEWSCPVIGGNIKDGSVFAITGSALGNIKMECLMRRIGAKPGDRVCVIGEMGIFWAAVLTRLFPDIHLDKNQQKILDRSLYKPVARIHEGIALANTRKATACMDSSDGIAACLYEIAMVNQVDIVINSESLQPVQSVSQVAEKVGIDARKLMLSWGNWELVFTVSSDNLDMVKSLIESLGAPCINIGEVRIGSGKVWLDQDNRLMMLTNFGSERFCSTSTFTHGLEAYISFLRENPLVIGVP